MDKTRTWTVQQERRQLVRGRASAELVKSETRPQSESAKPRTPEPAGH
jgi:hypothetical protein